MFRGLRSGKEKKKIFFNFCDSTFKKTSCCTSNLSTNFRWACWTSKLHLRSTAECDLNHICTNLKKSRQKLELSTNFCLANQYSIMTLGVIITTLHFLLNLRLGQGLCYTSAYYHKSEENEVLYTAPVVIITTPNFLCNLCMGPIS